MPTIETARLTLCTPTLEDIGAFSEMDADPEVMRYIGDGRVYQRTHAESVELIGNIRARWDERGFGLFSVTLRETSETLGWVTLAVPTFLPEIMPTVEIGWRFLRRHWGFGFATEAARPVLDYGFTVAELGEIVSVRRVENAASGRVMEKIGLRFSHETVVPHNGTRVAVYSLGRESHNEARAAAQASS